MLFTIIGSVSYSNIDTVYANEKLVNSKGLFINYSKKSPKCKEIKIVEDYNQEEDEFEGYDVNKLIASLMVNIGTGTVDFLAKQVNNLDSCGREESVVFSPGESEDEDIEDGDSESTASSSDDEGTGGMSFGIFNQIGVFSLLVNVTNVNPVMFLTSILQSVSMLLLVFFLLYQVVGLLRGKRGVREDSVVKGILRFGVAMVLVYYAPALMQDILSLNNKLVHIIGEQEIAVNFGDDKVKMPIKFAAIGSFAIFLRLLMAALFSVGAGGSILIFLGAATVVAVILIMFAMIALVLFPILKIVIWWYTRVFKLFVFTILSPLFLMTFSLPETTGYGKRFVVNFTKTSFEQFFVMIGFAMLLVFFSELPKIAIHMNLGFVGIGLGLYAGLTFISQLPDIVGIMMDGAIGFDSRESSQGLTNSYKKSLNKAKVATMTGAKRVFSPRRK